MAYTQPARIRRLERSGMQRAAVVGAVLMQSRAAGVVWPRFPTNLLPYFNLITPFFHMIRILLLLPLLFLFFLLFLRFLHCCRADILPPLGRGRCSVVAPMKNAFIIDAVICCCYCKIA